MNVNEDSYLKTLTNDFYNTIVRSNYPTKRIGLIDSSNHDDEKSLVTSTNTYGFIYDPDVDVDDEDVRYL